MEKYCDEELCWLEQDIKEKNLKTKLSENFKNILHQNSYKIEPDKKKTIREGKVLGRKKNFVLIDLGLKTNVKYPLKRLININKKNIINSSIDKNSSLVNTIFIPFPFITADNNYNLKLSLITKDKKTPSILNKSTRQSLNEKLFFEVKKDINSSHCYEIKLLDASLGINNLVMKTNDINPWDIIKKRLNIADKQNYPQIKGRLLNTIKGGFSIGLAGIIAFLPQQLLLKPVLHVTEG